MASSIWRTGTRLHGREAEFDVTHQVARRLSAGQGSVVVWLGDPGTGKSALLRAAAEEIISSVEDVGAIQVTGRGATGPLETIRSVVTRLLPLAPQASREGLERVLRPGSERDDDPRELLRAAATVLAEASARRPIVITIDDGRILEDQTWAAVSSAAARIASLPVAVLVAERAREGAPPPLSVEPLWARPLGGLSTDASVAVVRDSTRHIVSRWVAAELGRRLAGNPGALKDVTRRLSREELRGLTPLPDPLPPSPCLVERYRPWFDALQPSHFMLVLCAALALRRRADVLESAAGVGVFEVCGMDGEPWARETSGAVDFVDPALRTAVVGAATHHQIMSAHADLARAFGGDPEAKFWHRAEAGEQLDDQGIAFLASAAYEALECHAYAGVLTAAKHAFAHYPRGEPRAELALAAGTAAYHAGYAALAASLLHECIEDTSNPATRYQAMVALSLSTAIRDGTAPVALIDRSLEQLTENGQNAGAASLAALAARLTYDDHRFDLARDFLARAEHLAHAALEMPDAAGSPSHEHLTSEIEHSLHWVLGAHPPATVTTTHLASVTSDWPARDLISWDLAVRHTALLSRLGDSQQAQFAAAELDNRQERLGSPAVAAQTAVVALDRLLSLGAIGDAEEFLSGVVDDRPLCQPFGGIGPCLVARVLILRDALPEAREWLDLARQLDHAAAHAAIHLRIAADLALLAGVEGDPVEAARLLAVAVQRSSHSEHPAFADVHFDLLEARQAAGLGTRTAEVLPILEYAWAGEGSTPGRHAMLAAARLLAAPTERIVAAVVAAVDAAEWQESPLWSGRVRTIAARALGLLSPAEHSHQLAKIALSDVPADRDEHRRDLLGDATRLFEECGAAALARLSRSSLALLGGDDRSPDAGAPTRRPRLTKDEERVATLVVGGATNRQVASTTYVSVRTVELRLTSIYRKLGISSRKELPDALSALAAENPHPQDVPDGTGA